jgi:hypothetical protein
MLPRRCLAEHWHDGAWHEEHDGAWHEEKVGNATVPGTKKKLETKDLALVWEV